MWVIYAILSSFFAALMAILSKIGLKNIDSNLATAIRTIVVLVFSWIFVIGTGKHNEILNIDRTNLLFLLFSGIATGLSWIFYYKALQLGDVSKVMPFDSIIIIMAMLMAYVILKETISVKAIIGGILIAVGTFIAII
jgi:transporter family protein